MNEARMQEIAERLEWVTPGPWITEHVNSRGRTYRTRAIPNIAWTDQATLADQDFIVHARQDIPDLLTALTEANARLEAKSIAGHNNEAMRGYIVNEQIDRELLSKANARIAELEAASRETEGRVRYDTIREIAHRFDMSAISMAELRDAEPVNSTEWWQFNHGYEASLDVAAAIRKMGGGE